MRGKSKIQLVMLTLLFVVAMSFSAYGADGQIKITQPDSFPVVIDEPGSYVLTSNVTVSTNVNGIVINASDVTLDLNGHAIIGPGSGSGNGIYAFGKHNITIKNGTVRGFGKDGLIISGTNLPNYRVENIRVISNGINGMSTLRATIINCMAADNGQKGIFASSSTVINCKANYNGQNGISVSNSPVSNCTAAENGQHGIYAPSSTVINCTAYSNGEVGIYASNSTVINGTAHSNGEDGIYASNSTITDFTANHNSSNGIYASNSTVTNCVANKNKGDGIKVSYCAVRNCTMFGNEGTGIYVIDKCRIEGNNLRENGSYELKVSGIWNYVIKNVLSDGACGGNFSIDAAQNYVSFTGDNANYVFCWES